MFGFFKKHRHKKRELAVVYDIGSGSVGAALVYLKRESQPEIIFTTRAPVPFQEQLDPERLLLSMKSKLQQVSEEVQKKGMRRLQFTHLGDSTIEGIYCVFSSPWYIAQTHHINTTFDEQKEIKEADIQSLVKQAEEEFDAGPLSEYASRIEDELQPLEKNVIQVKLNGYETAKPINKKAKKVALSIYFSIIPKQVIQDTRNSISSIFHTEHFHYHSFTLSSFSVLRNVFSDIHVSDFLFLDISGELTDVSLIRDGILVKSMSFPIGKHFLVRSLKKALDIEPEEALSRISMKKRGSLHTTEEERVNSVVKEVEKKWQESFKETVIHLLDEVSLPHRLFFVADSDIGDVFKRVIESTDIGDHGIQKGHITASHITEDMFDQYCTYRKKTERDPFLSMETIFANTVTASDSIL